MVNKILSDQEIEQHLREAAEAVDSGKDYEMPKEVDESLKASTESPLGGEQIIDEEISKRTAEGEIKPIEDEEQQKKAAEAEAAGKLEEAKKAEIEKKAEEERIALEKEKDDTEYQKALKGKDRLEDNFKKFNEEKGKFYTARDSIVDRLKAKEAELDAKLAQIKTPGGVVTPQVHPTGSRPTDLTVEDYRNAAVSFENNGEYEKADFAKRQADDMEKAVANGSAPPAGAVIPYQQRAGMTEPQSRIVDQEWNRNLDAAVGIDSDIGVLGSTLNRAVHIELAKDPSLELRGDGIKEAVARAKGQKSSEGSVDEIMSSHDKALEEANEEIKRLEKKTSLSSSNANLPVDQKTLEERAVAGDPNLTEEEVRRLAIEYDAGR